MNRTIKATGEPLEVGKIESLVVTTRVPKKYLLVDTETGQVYRGNTSEKYWIKIPVHQQEVDSFVQTVLGEDSWGNDVS